MNEISDDDDEDTGILENATARDSLALQAYLRERKSAGSKAEGLSPATASYGGMRAASPDVKINTMKIEELDNSLTVLTPGLRVKTNFTSTRGSPSRRSSSDSPARYSSASKRFDEGGGVYIDDSTRSLRSMVKQSYEEKRKYQQALHEKQLEIEALKKSFLEMSARSDRLNLLLNRSKKVTLPNRLGFILERWATRALYTALHRWMNVVSEYSKASMKRKEDMMNRERRDWLTVREQWIWRNGELSSVILARTVRSMIHSRVSKAFYKWFSVINVEKQCNIVKDLWIAPISDRFRLKLVYSRWKSLVTLKKGAFRLLHKTVSRMCFRAVLSAWNHWRNQLSAIDGQKKRFIRAMSIVNSCSPYARCLEKWRHFAFITEPRRMRLYNLLNTSSSKKSRFEQRQYFKIWRNKSTALRMIPFRVEGGIQRSLYILTKSFFHKWSASAKKTSKLQSTFSSLNRCAKKSSLTLKQDCMLKWYRATAVNQISDLRWELSKCRSELETCHDVISGLNENIEKAQIKGVLKSEEYSAMMKKSVLRHLVLNANRQYAAKYFSLWRLQSADISLALKHRRAELLGNVASKLFLCGKSKISTSFRIWMVSTQMSKQALRDLRRMGLILQQSLRRRCFLHWAKVSFMERRKEHSKDSSVQIMSRVVKKLSKQLKLRGISKWKFWLQVDKDKKSGAFYVRRLIVNGSCRQYFMLWKRVSSEISRREHCDYVAMVREKQYKHASSALRRLLLTPSGSYLLTWKEYTRACKVGRQAIKRVISSKTLKMLRLGLLTWRENIFMLKRFTRLTGALSRGLLRYIHGSTQSAFVAWRVYSKRKRDLDGYHKKVFELERLVEEGLENNARIFANKNKQLELALIFQAWRQHASSAVLCRASKGSIIFSSIRRMLKNKLYSYFSTWARKTSTFAYFESVMKKSLSRLVYRKMDAAMKLWSRNVFIMTSDSHIIFLKHANELNMSLVESKRIVQRIFHMWVRYTLTRGKNRSLLRRCYLRLVNRQLFCGFNTWKVVLSTGRKLKKLLNRWIRDKLRVALFTWKCHTSYVYRLYHMSHIIKRMVNYSLLFAWRKWYDVIKIHKRALRLLEGAIQYWNGNCKLRLSTAFYRMKIFNAISTKREGYSSRTQDLHKIRGNMKCMRKAFDAWKTYSATLLKSRGIEIMSCVENIFPMLKVFSDRINPENEFNQMETALLMDGEEEERYDCSEDLRFVIEGIKNVVQDLLPEFTCSVYAFNPDTEDLQCSESHSVVNFMDRSTQGSPNKVVSGAQSFAGGLQSPSLMKRNSTLTQGHCSPAIGKSSESGDLRRRASPLKGGMSTLHPFESRGGLPILHSLQDFDEDAFENANQSPYAGGVGVGSPTYRSPDLENRSDPSGHKHIGIGPFGGDIGVCAQTGTHIVRRSLISDALLFCKSQRPQGGNAYFSPDKNLGSPLTRRTPSRSADQVGRGIFGRSLSRGVSFSPVRDIFSDTLDGEDDYIYDACIPISSNGSVVGVLRLRSEYLSNPHMTQLAASGFDVLSRPDCIVGDSEKQSWFLFSKSIEAATLQVYPACTKVGLDIERSIGLDTATRLGGWAIMAIVEKYRRKKLLRNHLMLNPIGPTRKDVISQLQVDKERMHEEIQELTSKLLQTNRKVDQMTEKSVRHKNYAESWKKRSDLLKLDLEAANERIKFLIEKYGDVKRIHDSLQRVTKQTFAIPDSDEDSSFEESPFKPII